MDRGERTWEDGQGDTGGSPPRACPGTSEDAESQTNDLDRQPLSTRRRTSTASSVGGRTGGGGSSSRSVRLERSGAFGQLLWQKLRGLSPLHLVDLALPVIHPAARGRIIWDAVMLCVVLYIAIFVPLATSFSQVRELRELVLIDWMVTALLITDIFVIARTAYITPQGDLVRDSKHIARRYTFHGMFVLDVISCMPYSRIFEGHMALRYITWLTMAKMLHLGRLVRSLRGSGRWTNPLSMGRLVVFMLLIAHWSCCFWHLLSECIPGQPWMFSKRCESCADSLHYLLGFYKAFLLLMGDKPEAYNNIERVLVTVLLFMGTLFYAIVVGSMTLLVANMFATASRHKQRAAAVNDALRYRGCSEEVREKVGEFYDYLARHEHPGSEGVAFLAELPVGLYGTAMAEMFGPVLSRVQLFAHCERPFTWRLAQKLRLSLFMAGDVIYNLGSVGHNMFIIWTGAVGLVEEDGALAALLTDGDHFGELGLMTARSPRLHGAVSLRPCDVLLLSRWDLQDAMKDFPESAALVKDHACRRMEDHEVTSNVWAFAMAALGAFVDADGRLVLGEECPADVADGGYKWDGGSGAMFRRRQRQVLSQRDQQETEALTHLQLQQQPASNEGIAGKPTDAVSSDSSGGLVRPSTMKRSVHGPVSEARERVSGAGGTPATASGPNDPSTHSGRTYLMSFLGRKKKAEAARAPAAVAAAHRSPIAAPSQPVPTLPRRAAVVVSQPLNANAIEEDVLDGLPYATLEAAQRPGLSLASVGSRLFDSIRRRTPPTAVGTAAAPSDRHSRGSPVTSRNGTGGGMKDLLDWDDDDNDSQALSVALSGLSRRQASFAAAAPRVGSTLTAAQRQALTASGQLSDTGGGSLGSTAVTISSRTGSGIIRADRDSTGQQSAGTDPVVPVQPAVTVAAGAGGRSSRGSSSSTGFVPQQLPLQQQHGSRLSSHTGMALPPHIARMVARQPSVLAALVAAGGLIAEAAPAPAGADLGPFSLSAATLSPTVSVEGMAAANAAPRLVRHRSKLPSLWIDSLLDDVKDEGLQRGPAREGSALGRQQLPAWSPSPSGAWGHAGAAPGLVTVFGQHADFPLEHATPFAAVQSPVAFDGGGYSTHRCTLQQRRSVGLAMSPLPALRSVEVGNMAHLQPGTPVGQYRPAVGGQQQPAVTGASMSLTMEDVWRQIQAAAGHNRSGCQNTGNNRRGPGARSPLATTGSITAANTAAARPPHAIALPPLFSDGMDAPVVMAGAHVHVTADNGPSFLPSYTSANLPDPRLSTTGLLALAPPSQGVHIHRSGGGNGGGQPTAFNSGAPSPNGAVPHGRLNFRRSGGGGSRAACSSASYSQSNGRSAYPTSLGTRLSEERYDDGALLELGLDGENSWSSSDGGHVRGGRRKRQQLLVATLQRRLGDANARVAALESQLTDVLTNPYNVPTIAARVQREVQVALSSACTAMDGNLTAFRDRLLGISVRAEDLTQQVAAVDDRLQRLEDVAASGDDPPGGVGGGGVLGVSIDMLSGSMVLAPAEGCTSSDGAGQGQGDARRGSQHNRLNAPMRRLTYNGFRESDGVERRGSLSGSLQASLLGSSASRRGAGGTAGGRRASTLSQVPVIGILKNASVASTADQRLSLSGYNRSCTPTASGTASAEQQDPMSLRTGDVPVFLPNASPLGAGLSTADNAVKGASSRHSSGSGGIINATGSRQARFGSAPTVCATTLSTGTPDR